MAVVEGFGDFFQRVGRFSHGGDDDQQPIVGIAPENDRDLTDTFYAVYTGAAEFENLHGANLLFLQVNCKSIWSSIEKCSPSMNSLFSNCAISLTPPESSATSSGISGWQPNASM